VNEPFGVNGAGTRRLTAPLGANGPADAGPREIRDVKILGAPRASIRGCTKNLAKSADRRAREGMLQQAQLWRLPSRSDRPRGSRLANPLYNRVRLTNDTPTGGTG